MASLDIASDVGSHLPADGSRSIVARLRALWPLRPSGGTDAVPSSAAEPGDAMRRDPAGPLGRDADRWIDMLLCHLG